MPKLIYIKSPYRKKRRLHYKDQLVSAVQENDRSLFWNPAKAPRGKKCELLNVKADGVHTITISSQRITAYEMSWGQCLRNLNVCVCVCVCVCSQLNVLAALFPLERRLDGFQSRSSWILWWRGNSLPVFEQSPQINIAGRPKHRQYKNYRLGILIDVTWSDVLYLKHTTQHSLQANYRISK
jgi:hypothetical protein